jgi:hypothetical protein
MDFKQMADDFIAKWKKVAAEQKFDNERYAAVVERVKQKDKPIVHYLGDAGFYSNSDCVLAVVNALDHPKLGNQVVHTSIVISIEDTGDFETVNTRYVKVSNKDVVAYLAGERISGA